MPCSATGPSAACAKFIARINRSCRPASIWCSLRALLCSGLNSPNRPGVLSKPAENWCRPLRRPRHPMRDSIRAVARFLVTLPARAVSGLIWIYQRTISPALAVISPTCGCRFAPTCSHYAREALQQHGLFIGACHTLRRLVKCGPWHPGGLDPVPPRGRPICTAVRHSG